MSLPQIVVIMFVGYALVMGLLALGVTAAPGQLWPARRRGWPGLIGQVAGTAMGGFLLLMAVVIAYYYGVARLGGGFLMNAFTGCLKLLGIALPLFLAASWLVERLARRRRPTGHPREKR